MKKNVTLSNNTSPHKYYKSQYIKLIADDHETPVKPKK